MSKKEHDECHGDDTTIYFAAIDLIIACCVSLNGQRRLHAEERAADILRAMLAMMVGGIPTPDAVMVRLRDRGVNQVVSRRLTDIYSGLYRSRLSKPLDAAEQAVMMAAQMGFGHYDEPSATLWSTWLTLESEDGA